MFLFRMKDDRSNLQKGTNKPLRWILNPRCLPGVSRIYQQLDYTDNPGFHRLDTSYRELPPSGGRNKCLWKHCTIALVYLNNSSPLPSLLPPPLGLIIHKCRCGVGRVPAWDLYLYLPTHAVLESAENIWKHAAVYFAGGSWSLLVARLARLTVLWQVIAVNDWCRLCKRCRWKVLEEVLEDKV